jgi:hypothetical protein
MQNHISFFDVFPPVDSVSLAVAADLSGFDRMISGKDVNTLGQ